MAKNQNILLSVSGELTDELDAIKERLGKSRQDVIRFALSLYVDIYKKSLQGHEVALIKGDKVTSLYMPDFIPSQLEKLNKLLVEKKDTGNFVKAVE